MEHSAQRKKITNVASAFTADAEVDVNGTARD